MNRIDRRDEMPKDVTGASMQVMRCLILLSGSRRFYRAVLSRSVWIGLRRALAMPIRSGSSLPCVTRGEQRQQHHRDHRKGE